MLVSASFAVGIRPGWFLNMSTWVEPLAQNSMYALAASSSSWSFGDLDEICQVSIGASSAFSASNWVPERREREEVEVVEVGLVLRRRELRRDEQAEQVHAGLLLDERVGRVLPGQARVVLGVERHDLRPLLEDGRDLRVGPLLLAGHQVDVEVVAVDAAG